MPLETVIFLLAVVLAVTLLAAWPKRTRPSPPPLPVQPAHAHSLLVVQTAPVKRLCRDCKHFDLEEGQAVIASFPSFQRVTQAVPPAQIARKVEREFTRTCRMCDGSKVVNAGTERERECQGCDGTGEVLEQELSAPGAPAKAKWDQMGACLKEQVVLWGGDEDKPCWEPRA